MSVQSDMAQKCAESLARGESPCQGELEITQQHLDDAQGSSLEAKKEDIKSDASTGCKQGCLCQKVKSMLITKTVDGKQVEYVRTQCISRGTNFNPGAPMIR